MQHPVVGVGPQHSATLGPQRPGLYRCTATLAWPTGATRPQGVLAQRAARGLRSRHLLLRSRPAAEPCRCHADATAAAAASASDASGPVAGSRPVPGATTMYQKPSRPGLKAHRSSSGSGSSSSSSSDNSVPPHLSPQKQPPGSSLWPAARCTAAAMAATCRTLLSAAASHVTGYAAATAVAATLLALNLAVCGPASAVAPSEPTVSVLLVQQQQQQQQQQQLEVRVDPLNDLQQQQQQRRSLAQPRPALLLAEPGMAMQRMQLQPLTGTAAGVGSVHSAASATVETSALDSSDLAGDGQQQQVLAVSQQQQQWQEQQRQQGWTGSSLWQVPGAASASAGGTGLGSSAASPAAAAAQQFAHAGYSHLTHLGTYRFEVASEAEDKLLELVRQVETRVGSAVGSVTSILEGAEDSLQASATARTLINEVWEVVDQNYLDARSTGFDRAKWAQLRDNALAQQYSSTAGVYRAVREMLAWGVSDPYCRFIPPSELAAMKKYDVTGVGLNLGTAEEFVRKTGRQLPRSWRVGDEGIFVVGISKGSASDVAGIQQGDQLVKVDGKNLAGVSPFQAASLIQGQADDTDEGQGPLASMLGTQQQKPSSVSLQVRRPDGTVSDVRLERPVKTTPSPVTSRLVKAGMLRPEPTGLLRLTSFNARAHRDLAQAITQLEESGVQSLVLDLRDNRGGLVSEGLEVARLFLSPGQPIVITESRTGPNQPLPDPSSSSSTSSSSTSASSLSTAAAGMESAGPGAAMAAVLPSPPPSPPSPASVDIIPMAEKPPRTELPLTLLVNDHTASAAEILAGALKDNCRAVLVGSQTYGKGLIQSVYELSDGSGMVVTVGKYLTPSRIDIDRYGIRPNFNSQPTSEQFTQELDACRISKEHDVLVEIASKYRQQQALTQAGRS